MADVRYALRSLASGKFTTVAAILSLSLGIAATTTFFSLLNSLFIRSLPVPAPDALYTVATGHDAPGRYSVFEYLNQNSVLDNTFAINSSRVDTSPSTEKKFVDALFVSSNAFDVLQIKPRLGRMFKNDDRNIDIGAPVILGFAFWKSQYGGAEDVIGKSISVSKRPHVVVGVAPSSFAGLVVGSAADLILPLPTQNQNAYVTIIPMCV
jgi:putative ABC transport system permease protein